MSRAPKEVPLGYSLRVAAKYGVRFVPRLVDEMTIDLTSLRAAIRIWPQRIAPTN